MIFSGTGNQFCQEMDTKTFSGGPEAWFEMTWEGQRILTALLDIDIPVIGVANGPAHIRSELLLLSDVRPGRPIGHLPRRLPSIERSRAG